MQKRCFLGFITVLAFCLLPSTASLQQLNFKTYSFKEGLLSYNVFKTAQDKYGFIWIATQDGLFRYNGSSFEIFKNNTGTETSTLGNAFLSLEYDGNNKIYCADYRLGIDIIDVSNLSISYVNTNNSKYRSLPNFWITTIFIDRNKNTWIGGVDFLAYKKETDSVFTVMQQHPGGFQNVSPTFLKAFGKNHVAVGIPQLGTLIYNIHSLKLEQTVKSFYPLSYKTQEEASGITEYKDTIIVASSSGFIKGLYRHNKWEFIQNYTYPLLNKLLIKSVVCDRNDIIWAGTNNGLLKVDVQTGKFELLKAQPGNRRWLDDNSINHLMIDRENNLWISTSNFLQSVNLNDNGIKSYNGEELNSDPMDHLYTLCLKDSTTMYATGTTGLFKISLSDGISKKIKGTEDLGYIHHIENIDPDSWILSTDKGMHLYQESQNLVSQKKFLQKFPEWEKFKYNYFNTVYKYKNSWYWASEETEGLLKWDLDKRTVIQYKAGTNSSGGLPENHLRNLKLDKDGALWILSDFTAAKFDLLKDSVTDIIQFNQPPLNTSLLFDMYDDGRILWFSTYGGGLNGYHKKNKTWTQITEQSGLSNNCVYGILPENDSVLWVSTNMGLTRINISSFQCTKYFYEDGLQDNSFDEKSFLKNGSKLYFGGVKGFSEINTDILKNDIGSFGIYIHKIEYYQKGKKTTISDLSWHKIELPPGSGSVILHTAALTYALRSNINLSYKIEGKQDNFIELDKSGKITLNGLSKGTYLIILKCKSNNNLFQDKTSFFTLVIRPKWYETWWFKSFMLIIAIAAVYLLYSIRINQLKKEQQIRSKLASDLHDDLGGTMNSVKVYTNLAIMEKPQDKHLFKIKESAQEAIAGIRDIIWVLDDSKDSIEQLFTRIANFASPLCEANGILFVLELSDEARDHKLGQEEKRNLYMMMKEAVNNAIKYSAATKIQMVVSIKKTRPFIEIKDNGKGFDTSISSNGNGLQNMKRRAIQIKYQFHILSNPDEGTTISFQKL